MALREKHPDVYAEIDRIRGQLSALSQEVERLTASPVELQANFDRFGYNARIRIHDTEEHKEEEQPDDKTVNDQRKSPKAESSVIPVYRKPILRQYVINSPHGCCL